MTEAEKNPLRPQIRRELDAFLDWALDTADERQARRRATSPGELKTFYNGVLPHVEAILTACDRYSLGELPEQLRPYYNLALSLAEVAPHMELYGGSPDIPFAFDETRFVARHGPAETWRGIPPQGKSDGNH